MVNGRDKPYYNSRLIASLLAYTRWMKHNPTNHTRQGERLNIVKEIMTYISIYFLLLIINISHTSKRLIDLIVLHIWVNSLLSSRHDCYRRGQSVQRQMEKGRPTQRPADLNISELHAFWEQWGSGKTTNSPGDQQTLINVRWVSLMWRLL